jgi:hypothetical protein
MRKKWRFYPLLYIARLHPSLHTSKRVLFFTFDFKMGRFGPCSFWAATPFQMASGIKTVIPVFLFLLLAAMDWANAQTLGRKKPKLELVGYSPLKDDGDLVFQIDVRLADCISLIELSSENSRKPLKVVVSENDYYLSEDGEEQIFMKISLGTLKEIMKKKKELPTELVIYSKSGKPIYTRQFNLNRDELVASSPRN